MRPSRGQLRNRATAQIGGQRLGATRVGGIGERVERHQVPGDGPGQGDSALESPASTRRAAEPTPSGEPVAAAAQQPTDAVEQFAGAAAVPSYLGRPV
jgi:hypothetical protein